MTQVTCRICKGKINKADTDLWIMPSTNYYYHKTCYEDFGKKKGAIKEGDIEVELDDEMWFAAVYDYLTKDLKMLPNFFKLSNQWKNFLKKGMTAKGIYFVLRYFYEIKHGDPSKSEEGIGIVPYIYDEGTCYWGERNQVDKGICDRIEKQILRTIDMPLKEVRMKKFRKNKKIDLSIIANMEEDK